MLGSRAQRDALGRILRLCQSVPDTRALQVQVLRELRRVVAADAYAWLLTDPSTCVGASPLAEVPWLPELPRQIRLKYLTPVNRWTSMTEPVALLDEVTGGELSRSLLWDELLGRYGVNDAASVVFRDRYGCWAFLELWRSGEAARFDRAEADFLADLVEPVTTTLRGCHANTFAAWPTGGLPPVGPIAVTIEEASAAERIDLFARTYGLSARERELVGHLAGGDNTREIARRMILSENTIQDHLKSVFAKTAARSRGALLARALGSASRRTP